MHDIDLKKRLQLQERKRVQEIKELRREYEKHGHKDFPKVRTPKHEAKYNYQVIHKGKIVTVKQYSKPIYTGYKRRHNPERKEGRRMANEQNTKRARRKVHDYVNTNITEYTKMVTLTYKETMLDYDQVAHDWKMFRRNLKRKGFNPPYLYITEHQTERGIKEGNKGSLHIHALLFTNEYIPFKTIKKSWGKRGSVFINKIENTDNPGSYVAKYITKEGTPPDKKSYRTSRNIKKPTVSMGFEEQQTELDLAVISELKKHKGVVRSSQYEYKRIEGISQDTGEIIEENDVVVTNYETQGKR